ncbi:thiol reductant ABC exporter subunit CydC [Pontibacillus salicampi]|uniref:Thiol reductant ABC exporter subunit CydC n=1 Tax=Pontibacillus salicampi TaxID=1449801 RepID=A0ABV6LN36_9BACI
MKDLQIVLKELAFEKRDILLSVLFGFLAGITAVGLFASSGYLISKAALTPPIYTLSIMIAFLKLFGFARAFGRYVERYFSHRATFTILSRLRVSFFERIEPLAPRIFREYRSGDLLARIVGDIDRLQHFFLRVFYPPIVLVLIFLATIFFTTFFSLSISLLLLLGVGITGFVLPGWFYYKQRTMEPQVRKNRGMLSTEVTEFFYGFKDLKLNQKLSAKQKQLEEVSNTYVAEQEQEGKAEVFHQSLSTMATLVVSWLVITVGSYLVVQGDLNGIFLAMLVMISLTAFENATPMSLVPGYLQDSRVAAKRLYSSVERRSTSEKEEGARLPEERAYTIDMEEVSFAYPKETRLSVNAVSLHLKAGEKVAIVGPSGSGKSTLLELLLSFYPDFDGAIRLNKNNIDEVEESDLWAKTNVVLQHNHFFYGTIRDNIQLAKDDATDEEIREALAKVQLDHFDVEQEVLEKGENLSGGEKQRLAIARTLLKSAHVWLLDEPTSSVDVITEQAIFRHLLTQAQNDTVLLVSHRLIGLENMDRIIVMDEGEIIESGTWDELMKQQGYFFEMKQIEQSILV